MTTRAVAAVTLALTLACSAIPAMAQQPRDAKPGTDSTREADRSSVGAKSVTGTVKKTTDKGFVLVGREPGQKEREWAFALDAGTRINADAKVKGARELREGDTVTVTYSDRDGKIVATSVQVMTR
jgi:hypothetical protein